MDAGVVAVASDTAACDNATGLFVALPLKIGGGSGSPTRVLLIHQGGDE